MLGSAAAPLFFPRGSCTVEAVFLKLQRIVWGDVGNYTRQPLTGRPVFAPAASMYCTRVLGRRPLPLHPNCIYSYPSGSGVAAAHLLGAVVAARPCCACTVAARPSLCIVLCASAAHGCPQRIIIITPSPTLYHRLHDLACANV